MTERKEELLVESEAKAETKQTEKTVMETSATLMLPPEPKKEEDYLARIRDEYFPDLMKKDVEEKLEELIEQYFHRLRMEY